MDSFTYPEIAALSACGTQTIAVLGMAAASTRNETEIVEAYSVRRSSSSCSMVGFLNIPSEAVAVLARMQASNRSPSTSAPLPPATRFTGCPSRTSNRLPSASGRTLIPPRM